MPQILKTFTTALTTDVERTDGRTDGRTNIYVTTSRDTEFYGY